MKIVAKALATDVTGHILVLRRSDTHPHFAHHFDFPGGEVELGENPASAVAREIDEETGLAIKASDLRLAFDKNVGSELKHMLFTVNLDTAAPIVSLSWEHDDYTWLTKSAASKSRCQMVWIRITSMS